MANNTSEITLLIVDDDNITRRLVAKSLTKEGFNVIDASNGEEAITICRERSPDLVILDVMMPVMDGYTVCRKIREFADDTALPIVMLTGANDVESVEMSYTSGATDFITKPVQWALLSQRVKYALRNRDMKKELLISQIRLEQSQKIAKMGYVEILSDRTVILPSQTRYLVGLHHDRKIHLNDIIEFVDPDEREIFKETIDSAFSTQSGYVTEFRMMSENDTILHILNSMEHISDSYSKKNKLVGTIQDITRYKNISKQLDFQMNYDPLTSLPNRKSFSSHLTRSIRHADNNETLLPVFMIAIDDLKRINDTSGHRTGDEILKEVANILSNNIGSNIYASRFSSHIFAVVAEDIRNFDQIDEITDRISKKISNHRFLFSNNDHRVTASIGISIYPLESDNEDDILKGADTALQYSKKHGGNQANFSTKDMNQLNLDRMRLEEDLRNAYKNNEFELYYQPQICAKTEDIIGAEALIRWNHKDRGFVFPDVFISVAEEMGLINDIGLWVFKEAAEQAKRWSDSGLGNFKVSVNMSSKQFEDPCLIEKISSITNETGINPSLIEIEVTESIAINNFEDIYETLDTFQRMGFHTSMDDFGTGYSSLSYLQKLPLNTLKIDRAFVKDIGDNGENGSIAAAILALSHSLGLIVIGEGIETKGQLEFLRQHQCDIIQGYYYSKPIPPHEFVNFVKQIGKAA